MATVKPYEAADGSTTYVVKFRIPKPDGGTKQTSDTFTDPKAAERYRQLVELVGGVKARAELARAHQHAEGITLDQLAEKFFEWKARPNRGVTGRTVAEYRRDYDNWIREPLGGRPAEAIDEVDVQEWVDAMEASGRLSPKSIAGRHMILNSIYDFGRAKTRRLVDHNPCGETELPRQSKKRAKGTTIPEYQGILAALEQNAPARDLVEFMGETGWRWSEAAALPYDVVELDGDDVWVTVAQVFRIIEGRQVLVVDEAKTWAAFRRIRLFPASAATVRRRMIGLGPGDLVFTNSRGNHWNQNTFLRETWPAALRRAELWKGPRVSPTPKWLRNMHVAVLVAAGASLPEIQRRVGHESIQTTIDVYGGMVGDISQTALAKADALMHGTATVSDAQLVHGEVVAGELEAGEQGQSSP